MKNNLAFAITFAAYFFLMRKFFVVLFLLLTISASAQEEAVTTDTLVKDGMVVFVYDKGIEELIEKYKKSNYSNPGLEGFRVQIFTGAGNDSKDKAEKALQDFLSSFPDEVAYLTYQQPNFKVRCGDFRTKSEARKLMKKISYQYPGSYIVKDNIKVD